MKLSGADIQRATAGHWHGSVPKSLHKVMTDTRDFQAGEAFLALRGPNFNGHSFAASVADRALALIGDSTGVRLWSELKLDNSILEVNDTLQAFGDIAHAWRLRLNRTTVIAISGSYGKTSLRSILETGFSALNLNVAATHANLNNLIGVPQTLLAVPENADIAIIECGISEVGEMSRLAAIVQPDIAVLTGITAAHTEGLGGLSGVVREKALLLEGADWCALGTGVADLLQANHIELPQQGLSVDPSMDACVKWQLNGCTLTLTYHDQEGIKHTASITLALPAAHWASNLAFAASIMLRHLNANGEKVSLAQVGKALAGWRAPSGRLQPSTGKNDCLILDDSYNANPASMQAAIDTLRALEGHKVAILGDMAELGETAVSAHQELDINDIDRIYLIGTHMQALATLHRHAHWFASTDEALVALANVDFRSNDTVLIKASRSMGLEKIVQLLQKQEVTDAL